LDTLGIDVPPPPPKFRNGDDHYSAEDRGMYLKWLFDFMQALDEKVIIFKKKRRKNYRRTTGHRQELTRLRILDIKGIEVDKKSLTSVPKESVKHAPNVKGEKSSDILVA
jgi:hypothetical protein